MKQNQITSESFERAEPESVFEAHFSIAEIHARTRLSQDLLRRELRDYPGVLRLQHRTLRGKRGYVSIRVPESVFRRWYQRRIVGAVVGGGEVAGR